MVSRPQAFVFDFDGVIADTEPLHWQAWAAILRPCKIDFDWNDYCAIGRGVPDEEIVASLAIRYPQLDLEGRCCTERVGIGYSGTNH